VSADPGAGRLGAAVHRRRRDAFRSRGRRLGRAPTWRPRRLIGRAGVVPPIDEVTDAYVDLRTWCVRSDHGLGAKDHEADRWVAAVAIAGRLPLATEDSTFDDVPALHRVDPDGAPDEN
jgi:hypothetical protein